MGKTKNKTGKGAPISAHPAFPAIVALWFAALFGLGSLILPIALVEKAVVALGIPTVVAAAAPPLGVTTRIGIALITSGFGVALGLWLARKVVFSHKAEAARDRRLNMATGKSQPKMKKPISALEELGEEGLDGPLDGSDDHPNRRKTLAVTDDSGPSELLNDASVTGASAFDLMDEMRARDGIEPLGDDQPDFAAEHAEDALELSALATEPEQEQVEFQAQPAETRSSGAQATDDVSPFGGPPAGSDFQDQSSEDPAGSEPVQIFNQRAVEQAAQTDSPFAAGFDAPEPASSAQGQERMDTNNSDQPFQMPAPSPDSQPAPTPIQATEGAAPFGMPQATEAEAPAPSPEPATHGAFAMPSAASQPAVEEVESAAPQTFAPTTDPSPVAASPAFEGMSIAQLVERFAGALKSRSELEELVTPSVPEQEEPAAAPFAPLGVDLSKEEPVANPLDGLRGFQNSGAPFAGLQHAAPATPTPSVSFAMPEPVAAPEPAPEPVPATPPVPEMPMAAQEPAAQPTAASGDAPRIPEALRPVFADDAPDSDDESQDEHLGAGFALPLSSQAKAPVAFEPEADADHDEAMDEGQAAYSSLLDMKTRLTDERDAVRIDDSDEADVEDGSIEPVVVFPGQNSRRATPAADGPARSPSIAEDAASAAPFAAPAASPKAANAIPNQSEESLRDALEKLQRMGQAG